MKNTGWGVNPELLICHNEECRFNDAKPCEAAECCGGFMDTKTKPPPNWEVFDQGELIADMKAKLEGEQI